MFFDAFTFSAFAAALVAMVILIVLVQKTRRETQHSVRELARHVQLMQYDRSVLALCRAIHQLRPEACAALDFTIDPADGGGSATIAQWSSDFPRPTVEELARALELVAETVAAERKDRA